MSGVQEALPRPQSAHRMQFLLMMNPCLMFAGWISSSDAVYVEGMRVGLLMAQKLLATVGELGLKTLSTTLDSVGNKVQTDQERWREGAFEKVAEVEWDGGVAEVSLQHSRWDIFM